MADDDKKSPAVKVPAELLIAMAANDNAPMPPSLSVRSVRVIPDPVNRSPNGMPLDICEIEFYVHNQGNGTWMQWRDLSRFVCERGDAEKLLTAMGLKAK